MSGAAASAALLVDASTLRPARLVPPPSKSDAQRALILGHLLGQVPELGADPPADVLAQARGLQQIAAGGGDIDCADGGAPLRFLLGQAAVTPGHFRFFGTPRLGERPHGPLLDALRETLDVEIRTGDPWPIEVRSTGRARDARLEHGGSGARDGASAPVFRISGAVSSQFVSSVLLAAAALHLRERRPWLVELTGPTASAGYLDLTLQWMARAGFHIAVEERRLSTDGWSDAGPLPAIPGDWSSIGYLLLVAWRCGGSVARADAGAAHPDREILAILQALGLNVGPDFSVSGTPRRGIEASAARCPDLIPTLAALACVLPAPSRFTDVGILQGKESDRLQGVLALVAAAGGSARHARDAVEVEPPACLRDGFRIESRGDHRLAMSGATLAVLGRTRAVISDPHCVGKSFPGFWRQLQAAGVTMAAMRVSSRDR